MKHLKPLPKNPLVQRMEDMQIPGMPNKKITRAYKMYQRALDRCAGDVTFPIVVPERTYTKGVKINSKGNFVKEKPKKAILDTPDVFDDPQFSQREVLEIIKDIRKVPHTREYLRPISDPHHGRHVFMVLVLIAALLFAVVVL